MSRLNKERQDRLTPIRIKKALEEITKKGYKPNIISGDHIQFIFKNKIVSYYAYSGWASGKSIKDGRGLSTLLKQIIN